VALDRALVLDVAAGVAGARGRATGRQPRIEPHELGGGGGGGGHLVALDRAGVTSAARRCSGAAAVAIAAVAAL
jgi:hypothetical protein